MALLAHQLPVVAALQKHFKSRQTVKFGERDIHPPCIVSASVSSGKSVMLAECAAAVQRAAKDREKPVIVQIMVIQAQGLLCEQNSTAAWNIGLDNSVFSASCGNRKSTHYSVVYGTVGTIARALEQYRFTAFTEDEMALSPEKRARLKKFMPDLILIDEVHQCPFENLDSQYMRVLSHFYDLKPNMRLAGMTGSPFRGAEPIVGNTPEYLWKAVASIDPGDPDYPEGGVGNGIISTEFSIDEGWIVGPIFGFPDNDDATYDFSHLVAQDWSYPESELDAAVSDRELCLTICADIIKKTTSRKGVLIFAATKRHTRQIAAALKLLGVTDDQIGVITENTSQKEQTRLLGMAKAGNLKFTINVNVLTTGVNVEWWDTVVFMRPIGSLVLLIQAIGRVLRLLIQPGDVPMLERNGLTADERKDLIAASDKPDAMVLDYGSVMDTLGHLYESQMLEQAEFEKAKKEKREMINCPICGQENSPHARRCIGIDTSTKQRCDHFWHFRLCSCGTKNDQVARECRNQECRLLLVDPHAKLTGKHYTEGESIPVRGMQIEGGRGGKLQVRFELSDGRAPVLIYYPHAGKQPALNAKIWKGFVKQLPISERDRFRLGAMKAETILQNLHLIPVPVEISARENKGRWICGRMKFEEMEVAV